MAVRQSIERDHQELGLLRGSDLWSLPVRCPGAERLSRHQKVHPSTVTEDLDLPPADYEQPFAAMAVGRYQLAPLGHDPSRSKGEDGKVLWLSGRYDGVVYAIDTGDGHLIAKIKVGTQPHGLCVWPQPGRYSLGHTGVLR